MVNLEPLYALRAQQDAVDREIVEAIGKRVALREKISAFRIANNLPTIDPARVEAVLTQAESYASDYNVPKDMARQLFDILIGWSHHLDRQWRNNPVGTKLEK